MTQQQPQGQPQVAVTATDILTRILKEAGLERRDELPVMTLCTWGKTNIVLGGECTVIGMFPGADGSRVVAAVPGLIVFEMFQTDAHYRIYCLPGENAPAGMPPVRYTLDRASPSKTMELLTLDVFEQEIATEFRNLVWAGLDEEQRLQAAVEDDDEDEEEDKNPPAAPTV